MEILKLIKVDHNNNNNKFYNMVQLDNNTFEVTYGRVGSNGVKKTYPMSQWYKLYNEKKGKGYTDITSNSTVTTKITDDGFDKLKPEIKNLLTLLNKYAKAAFKINYTIEISDVTNEQINNAQQLINNINELINIQPTSSIINERLLSLYKIIPRKLKNVKAAMFPVLDTSELIDKAKDKMVIEQGLLDVVKSQLVQTVTSTDTNNTTDTTSDDEDILTKLGLEMDVITPAEEANIKSMLGSSVNKFLAAYKVINKKTQAKFDKELSNATNKKTMLLFHGSRAENWMGIIKSGLLLRPNAVTTGKLFNNGIYFANDADKSLGYVSGGRWNNGSANDNWIAVYEVHVGKQAKYTDLPNRNVDLAIWVPQNGYDSYYADKNIEKRYNLRKDEFIIYDENKCTIKYLIHIK